MLSTRGFEELLHTEPFLRLVRDGGQTVKGLKDLKNVNFEDGWRDARWQANKQGARQARAATVINGLEVNGKVKLQTSSPYGALPTYSKLGTMAGIELRSLLLLAPTEPDRLVLDAAFSK